MTRKPTISIRMRSKGVPHGLTLIELLIAVSIIAMTAAALGSLARATQISAVYVEGHSTAAQHARVTLERMQRAVRTATASETFPGIAMFSENVSGNRYPDTLVVWKPTEGTAAATPTLLPQFSELVVFCPNPLKPNELLEITSRNDARTVPALSNLGQWTSELWSLKTGNASKKVVLTDMLRTAAPPASPAPRGCARYEVVLRPSASELTSFRSGSATWNSLAWPQHWYSDTTGMRQTWVRMELQLMPHSRAGGAAIDETAIPFFGSASTFSEIQR